MVDIGFQPAAVEVAIGETIEFVFTNDGNLQHEAVFGDEGVQADHEVEMQEMTGMDMGHAGDDEMPMGDGDGMDMGHAGDDEMPIGDGDGHGDEGVVAVSVDPGGAQAVTMTFDELGVLVIGCHVPGHWDAGMRVDITIAT